MHIGRLARLKHGPSTASDDRDIKKKQKPKNITRVVACRHLLPPLECLAALRPYVWPTVQLWSYSTRLQGDRQTAAIPPPPPANDAPYTHWLLPGSSSSSVWMRMQHAEIPKIMPDLAATGSHWPESGMRAELRSGTMGLTDRAAHSVGVW